MEKSKNTMYERYLSNMNADYVSANNIRFSLIEIAQEWLNDDENRTLSAVTGDDIWISNA